jgi:hypothetical protein
MWNLIDLFLTTEIQMHRIASKPLKLKEMRRSTMMSTMTSMMMRRKMAFKEMAVLPSALTRIR